MMNQPQIVSDWEFLYDSHRFQVPPPQAVTVCQERHTHTRRYEARGGWNDGSVLRALEAAGCSLVDGLIPGSARFFDPAGTELLRGIDYELNERWATFGRLAAGDDAIFLIDYRYLPMRIDGLFRDDKGELIYRQGIPAVSCPEPPPLCPGEKRELNIYLDSRTVRLVPDCFFPVLRESLPLPNSRDMQFFLPQTMEKLQHGRPLRILAWGDSVTAGTYLPRPHRWQEQFVDRLRALYPASDITLLTNGWGGRTIPEFMAAPSDSPFHYISKVCDADADLVISEFVNDDALPPEIWEKTFPQVLNDFRQRNKEWIILTPHYIRADWMHLPAVNGPQMESDPRPYVKFLRNFTRENQIALADAATLYGQLWQTGLPYQTTMTNNINHPDQRGMKLFADALIGIFALA